MEGISRIGFIDDLEVYVNTDDSGSVPHFHIKSKDGSFHSSVCIETPEYYFHDGDRDKLDPGTAAKLQRFMQSPVPFGNTGFLTGNVCAFRGRRIIREVR